MPHYLCPIEKSNWIESIHHRFFGASRKKIEDLHIFQSLRINSFKKKNTDKQIKKGNTMDLNIFNKNWPPVKQIKYINTPKLMFLITAMID